MKIFRFALKFNIWLKTLVGLILVIGLFVLANFSLRSTLLSRINSLPRISSQVHETQQNNLATTTIDSRTSISTSTQATLPAGWNKYIDPIYQYSIGYPPAWTVYKAPDGPDKDRRVAFVSHPLPLTIEDEGTPTVSVTVLDNSTGLVLQEWMETQFLQGTSNEIQVAVVPEQIEVHGMVGVLTTQLPSRWGSLDVFLPSDKYVFRLSLSPYETNDPVVNESSDEFVQFFYQMLNSFEAKSSQ